jgi:hypothetical protein
MNKYKNYGACQVGFIVFTSISSGNVSPYKWTRFDPKINIYLKKTTGYCQYKLKDIQGFIYIIFSAYFKIKLKKKLADHHL